MQAIVDMVGIRKLYSIDIFSYLNSLTIVFNAHEKPFQEYNPRYFPDPNAFKPSRWYEQETTDKSDMYTAFSVGEHYALYSSLYCR